MLSEVHKPQRVFTVAEATRTLPLVGRILKDIVAAHEEIETLHSARRREIGSRRYEEPLDDAYDGEFDLSTDSLEVRGYEIPGGLEAVEARIEEKVHEIDGCLRELDTIGCKCKDFRVGLVDFPAILDGRVVYLCWKLGEPEIAHWHEVDGGFSGRRPVHGVFS